MRTSAPPGPAEPTAAALAGDSTGARVKRLLLATRPAFAVASVAPVVVGSAWGFAVTGHLEWSVAVLALIATLCVHLAANVYNDVADDLSGADRINEERIFPYTGGSRFIQNGILTSNEMTVWAVVLLAIAAIVGLALIGLRGPGVLVFGLIGVALGICYSLPRVQLVARGVGEAAIAAAFGVLPVTGAAWLQTGTVDAQVILISVPVSLWVAAILLMNEVPDRAADARAGKATLVVRLGYAATRRVYLGLQAMACAAFLAAGALRLIPWWSALPMLALLPAAWKAARAIRDGYDRTPLTRAIETTLRLHLVGSVLLATAIVGGALLNR
jgi:1,4-dihydroxy-2-naphthoate polyprenyltransferase